MTATRSTKEYRIYAQKNRNDSHKQCAFCLIKNGDEQYVEETKNLKVIRNRAPYSIWDSQGVTDHLMIIPKRHTDKLGSFDAKTALEYIKLVDKYESLGYNLYARAPVSSVKSVKHQHTHLIKLDGYTKRFIFLMRKPFYIRLSHK
jgi:diadenosine tetraphosphate (Ap4A) HIT family hydrolase